MQRSLAPLGELTALGRQGHGGLCGDLSDPDSLAATVNTLAPDVIVNAAAYTAVDKAEAEPDHARTLNAEAPAWLARKAQKTGAFLVHYSTDYVFDGSGCAPWRENDPVGPLNIYGKTKLEGEEFIRQSGCRHLIFCTSWVYASRGKNFIYTIEDIIAVSSAEFPATAGRPGNSRLDTARLENTFDLCMPPWQNGVRRVVEQAAYCQRFNLFA